MPTEVEPLMPAPNPENWGSIQDVVNGPLLGVSPDEWWISVIGMWLFLPLNLIQGLVGGTCQCLYRLFTIGAWWIPGSTCWCSAYGAVLQGRPLYLAWNYWRCVMGGLVALLYNGKSRLALFLWEKEGMGDSGYFFQGEGIWTCPYNLVQAMLRAPQERRAAFACITACIPDLYAERLLIFLPNPTGTDSEWYAIRHALHQMFLNNGASEYRARVYKLRDLLANEWADPKVEDLTNADLIEKKVSKCVFYIMLGVWVTDEEAAVLQKWRSYAAIFIMPRLIQRFGFNIGINMVKKLRIDTVAIVEKYGKQDVFVKMNDSLPAKYRRHPVVALCDEIMYGVGFAGIGGTCAAVDAVGAFLQVKLPSESPGEKQVDFGSFKTPAQMADKYRESPEKYIKETLRLCPPVTSATSTFPQDTKVTMGGREIDVPKGVLNQYVLSIANRDESVFPNSKVFDPSRSNLNNAFTWNGAFGASDEASYPRICPGRYLSMDIVRIVVDQAIRHESELHVDPITTDAAGGRCW